MRSPRHGRVSLFAVTLLIAGALAGCGDDADDRPSGPGPRPGPIPTGGLSAVCDGAFYPDGAPYQGPGPHPTLVYWLGLPGGYGYFSTLLDESAETSQPWAAWAKGEESAIQLVACETAGSLFPAGATCAMEDKVGALGGPGGRRNLQMRAQSVNLTLYEVRTGRKVAEIPLDPSYECPEKYTLPSGQDWLVVKPSARQVQTSLLPHVTANLPATAPTPAG